jgi:hypothetical protein
MLGLGGNESYPDLFQPYGGFPDSVWIPPGEKHWHGAAPNTGMVHIAMQEALDGTHVTWLEHVTDEQYRVSPEA